MTLCEKVFFTEWAIKMYICVLDFNVKHVSLLSQSYTSALTLSPQIQTRSHMHAFMWQRLNEQANKVNETLPQNKPASQEFTTNYCYQMSVSGY